MEQEPHIPFLGQKCPQPPTDPMSQDISDAALHLSLSLKNHRKKKRKPFLEKYTPNYKDSQFSLKTQLLRVFGKVDVTSRCQGAGELSLAVSGQIVTLKLNKFCFIDIRHKHRKEHKS